MRMSFGGEVLAILLPQNSFKSVKMTSVGSSARNVSYTLVEMPTHNELGVTGRLGMFKACVKYRINPI
jgi:hypothetical protein